MDLKIGKAQRIAKSCNFLIKVSQTNRKKWYKGWQAKWLGVRLCHLKEKDKGENKKEDEKDGW